MASWLSHLLALAAGGACTVGAAALLAAAQRSAIFANLPSWQRQLAFGLIFGVAAGGAQLLGYDAAGAWISLCDAAPLAAGLLCGGPAGILAGILGGAARLAAASLGTGTYTCLAGALSAVVAGMFAASLHRWFFEDHPPASPYGFLVGLTMEAGHMLLIFFTHMGEVEDALLRVQHAALPMMLGTSVVTAAALAAAYKVSPAAAPARTAGTLEARLQRSLAICLTVSVCTAIALAWGVQSRLAAEDTESLLQVHLRDVPEALNDALENALSEYTVWTGQAYSKNSAEVLADATAENGILALLVVEPGGRITAGTVADAVGMDISGMAGAEQYLQAGPDGTTGPWRDSFRMPGTRVRYSAARLSDGSILIAEYANWFVAEHLRTQITLGALHRHIGTDGYLLLADKDGAVMSGPAGVVGNLSDLGFSLDGPQDTMLQTDVNGEAVQYVYGTTDTAAGPCTAVCVIPKHETDVNALVDICLTAFSIILIFFALFLVLSVLMRKRVVEEIHAVNSALGKITAGDLTCIVDVRSSDELAVLSDGINGTVAALRDLIAKEAARIDAELELARVIQRTSLPSVFPPFPGRNEFAICAMMLPAKDVGGDFYDFYLLGENRLAFLAADVSGKGIPAAMFMMRAKTELKRLAQSGLPLVDVFRRANASLSENNEASMFVTVWMGILDLATGEVEYVDAGHEPAIVVNADGVPRFAAGTDGFVLGGLDDFAYTSGSLTLCPGDTLILYTDGVTEAQNSSREQFTDARLLDSVRQSSGSVQDVCQAVHEEVDAFAAGAEQFDDLTLLALRFFGQV